MAFFQAWKEDDINDDIGWDGLTEEDIKKQKGKIMLSDISDREIKDEVKPVFVTGLSIAKTEADKPCGCHAGIPGISGKNVDILVADEPTVMCGRGAASNEPIVVTGVSDSDRKFVTFKDELLTLLVDNAILTDDEAIELYNIYLQGGTTIRDLVIEKHQVPEDTILRLLAYFRNGTDSVFDLSKYTVQNNVIISVPASIVRMYNIVPIEIGPNTIVIATYDLMTDAILDELVFCLSCKIQVTFARKKDILAHIDKYYKDGSDGQPTCSMDIVVQPPVNMSKVTVDIDVDDIINKILVVLKKYINEPLDSNLQEDIAVILRKRNSIVLALDVFMNGPVNDLVNIEDVKQKLKELIELTNIEEMTEQLKKRIEEEKTPQLMQDLSDSVRLKLIDELTVKVREENEARLIESLAGGIKMMVYRDMVDKVEAELRQTINDEAKENVRRELVELVKSELRKEFTEPIKDELRISLAKDIEKAACGGQDPWDVVSQIPGKSKCNCCGEGEPDSCDTAQPMSIDAVREFLKLNYKEWTLVETPKKSWVKRLLGRK